VLRTICPAKLNLFLSVGPKDSRGWHPLRSVFQAIDLCDTLSVELADQDSIETNVEWMPEANTLTKALAEFRKLAHIPPLQVKLEKTIPPQSGLGGGSSDAAGLLRILNEVAGDPSVDLAAIATKVGADVPFFLVGGKARAEGYGERLTQLDDPKESYFVVLKPEVDSPTPAMFKALDDLNYEWREFPESDELYNDFERVMPEVCQTRIDQLVAFGALSAGLTGSGSAVFGIFENHTEALTAAELVRNSGEENVWATRSLPRSECQTVRSQNSRFVSTPW
jgi:4-diphosphocytidyl-2-C-methyl-D-erythritol kinase